MGIIHKGKMVSPAILDEIKHVLYDNDGLLRFLSIRFIPHLVDKGFSDKEIKLICHAVILMIGRDYDYYEPLVLNRLSNKRKGIC